MLITIYPLSARFTTLVSFFSSSLLDDRLARGEGREVMALSRVKVMKLYIADQIGGSSCLPCLCLNRSRRVLPVYQSYQIYLYLYLHSNQRNSTIMVSHDDTMEEVSELNFDQFDFYDHGLPCDYDDNVSVWSDSPVSVNDNNEGETVSESAMESEGGEDEMEKEDQTTVKIELYVPTTCLRIHLMYLGTT